MKALKKILNKNNIDITNFQHRYKFIVEDIKTIIKKYLLFLYDDSKINIFQQKTNEFLST